jgi:uncharacterized protein YgbK (DUF1537 family)
VNAAYVRAVAGAGGVPLILSQLMDPAHVGAAVDACDGLLLTGGETAARVLRHLGVEALELRGEALPRVPVAVCIGGGWHGRPVALKAGAFGPADAIDAALERLSRGG